MGSNILGIVQSVLAYFTDLNAIQKKIIVYDESSVQPKILIPFAYYLALIVEDKGEENVLDQDDKR